MSNNGGLGKLRVFCIQDAATACRVMRKSRSAYHLLGAVAAVSIPIFAGTAKADTITINDPSLSQPTPNPAPGATPNVLNGWGLLQDNTDGSLQYGTLTYTNSTGGQSEYYPNFSTPTTTAYVNGAIVDTSTPGGMVWQLTSTPIQAGMTYTFTIQAAQASSVNPSDTTGDSNTSDTNTIELYGGLVPTTTNDGTTTGTTFISGTAPTDPGANTLNEATQTAPVMTSTSSTYATETVTYGPVLATDPALLAGDDIGIAFFTTSDSGQTTFMNASLSVTPEPTTLALVGLASMGLLARRRHIA
jgi:hypothetical protein